jgi:hypothetical protein
LPGYTVAVGKRSIAGPTPCGHAAAARRINEEGMTMNENTREAKAINGQELKPIEAGVTGLDEEQLAEVAGGIVRQRLRHNHEYGPRYKKKSLFGWNWYAVCKVCKKEVEVEKGDWSGDPD